MCKEDIRIARKFAYRKGRDTQADGNVHNVVPGRADRVKFSLCAITIPASTAFNIGGNIDPPTGNVAETVIPIVNGLIYVFAGEGKDQRVIAAIPTYLGERVLTIEEYGPVITEPLSLQAGSAAGYTVDWVETWVEQRLEDL